MSNMPVLLVDDERTALLCCKLALRYAGIAELILCQDSRDVLDRMAAQPVGMVLLDLSMPHLGGEELLPLLSRDYPEVPVIILTGANDIDTAVRCMRAGAFDYMVKPVEDSRLVSGVRRALEVRELRLENILLRERMQSSAMEHPEAFHEFITANPTVRAVLRYVETVAPTDKPVLITGETGVGKEIVARALHSLSGRRGEFVALNAGGADDNTFADTLFGHVKGAFTGADEPRGGLIERAAGGTLFLDEIGDLGVAAQTKLLRVLQEREYLPLGSDQPLRTDARVVVATNTDLDDLQRTGRFRRDLFYRLQTHRAHIPPLRERVEDIPLLVRHFLERAASALGRREPTPPAELYTLLQTYHFPGNVRELEAMVFEAVSRHDGGVLSMRSFIRYMEEQGYRPREEREVPGASPPLLDIPGEFPTIKRATDYLVDEALRRADGNQTIAARLLGISRPALSKRLSVRKGV